MSGEFSQAYAEIVEGQTCYYMDGEERKNFIAECLEADRAHDLSSRCSILTFKTGERLKVTDEVFENMEANYERQEH